MQSIYRVDVRFHSPFPKGIYIIIQLILSLAHIANLDQWITGNLGLNLDQSLFMFQHTDDGLFFRGGSKGKLLQVMQPT